MTQSQPSIAQLVFQTREALRDVDKYGCDSSRWPDIARIASAIYEFTRGYELPAMKSNGGAPPGDHLEDALDNLSRILSHDKLLKSVGRSLPDHGEAAVAAREIQTAALTLRGLPPIASGM